jgi:hypothetical protein
MKSNSEMGTATAVATCDRTLQSRFSVLYTETRYREAKPAVEVYLHGKRRRAGVRRAELQLRLALPRDHPAQPNVLMRS